MFVGEDGKPLQGRGHLAERLREHLQLAGVDRPELFKNTARRRHIWAHDMRATFVTNSLANDKTETWVSDRTGHTSSNMIRRYKRKARMLAEMNLGELTPLNEAIPELSENPPESD